MPYPLNPTTGDEYILGSKTWTYDGTNWVNQATFASGSSAGVANSPGTLIYHSANTAPTGYIKANGAAVSRTTYADLFTAIGTTYGAGDGSSTFNVPDLRGEFMRGWDDSRGIDTSRAFGSAQTDEFKSHSHDGYSNLNLLYSGGGGRPNDAPSGKANSGRAWETLDTGGTETRPRNIAFLACIKY